MYSSTMNKVRMVTIESKASDLIYFKESIPLTMPVGRVMELFDTRNYRFLAITDGEDVAGIVDRASIDLTSVSPEKVLLVLQSPVSRVMDPSPLIVDAQCDMVELFRCVVSRPEETVYHDVVVTDCGRYSGLVSVKGLMTDMLTLVERCFGPSSPPFPTLKKPLVATLLDAKPREGKATMAIDPYASIKALFHDNVLPVTLRGRLDTFSVVELLQVLVQGNKTGRLDLRGSEKGDTLFSVFFNNGKIVHALGNDEQGKNALWKVLKIKNGDFWFHPGVMNVSPTIREEPMFLLMEACRLQDEAAQGIPKTT